jgi:hypothetical protein
MKMNPRSVAPDDRWACAKPKKYPLTATKTLPTALWRRWYQLFVTARATDKTKAYEDVTRTYICKICFTFRFNRNRFNRNRFNRNIKMKHDINISHALHVTNAGYEIVAVKTPGEDVVRAFLTENERAPERVSIFLQSSALASASF